MTQSQAQILKADFGVSSGLRFPLLLSQLVSFVRPVFTAMQISLSWREIRPGPHDSNSGQKGMLSKIESVAIVLEPSQAVLRSL